VRLKRSARAKAPSASERARGDEAVTAQAATDPTRHQEPVERFGDDRSEQRVGALHNL